MGVTQLMPPPTPIETCAQCGRAPGRPSRPIEDFPILPATGDTLGVIPGHDAVAQVAISASRDESLPMLTAIRVEATPGKLTLPSTDRYRLALRELDWTGTSPPTTSPGQRPSLKRPRPSPGT